MPRNNNTKKQNIVKLNNDPEQTQQHIQKSQLQQQRELEKQLNNMKAFATQNNNQYQTQRIQQNLTGSNDILFQYISLMIEKQNFGLLRLDSMENTISKLVKENNELKEIITSMEDQVMYMSDQINEGLSMLNNKFKKQNDDFNDDYENKSCGDPDCPGCHPENNDYENVNNDDYDDYDNCDDCDSNNSNGYNSQNKKSSKSKKPSKNKGEFVNGDITVKVQGDIPQGINPLQLLMDQLTGGSQQKKETIHIYRWPCITNDVHNKTEILISITHV